MLQLKISVGIEMVTIFVTIQQISKEKMEDFTVVFHLQSNFNVFFRLTQDDYDNVLIAHCYPYTYTHLQKYLKSIELDPVKKNRFQRKFLCLT